MEIRKYTYVDVYYSEKDLEQAKRERKRLERLGYKLEAEDDGSGEHTYCDQYIRYSKTAVRENILLNQNNNGTTRKKLPS